ncbi:MAG: adenosylcobinamide-phosphate synthase CbiB [Alphaproteobacteria bacterium]|nr:adenosylcobinamide-phosphate synthase CbiB [Alphaproteobacteria bacterium]
MMQHVGVLLGGYGLESAVGYPSWIYRTIRHPVVWMGSIIALLERHGNRPHASLLENRLRGAGMMALLLALTIACSMIIQHLGWLAEMLAIAALLATRSLHSHVQAVADALPEGLEPARLAVSHIVGRDVSALDEHGVARAAIESLAESFCDGVVAPFLAALFFGLPGIAVVKAINTADSMVGHKDARYLHFGWAAARLDDAVNFIPARVSALLIVLAGDERMRESWYIMRRDSGHHASPNAGWPEAAMAGALGLRLAGPAVYEGESHHADFIGNGRAEATAADIKQALKIYRWANAILLVSTLLVAVLY